MEEITLNDTKELTLKIDKMGNLIIYDKREKDDDILFISLIENILKETFRQKNGKMNNWWTKINFKRNNGAIK